MIWLTGNSKIQIHSVRINKCLSLQLTRCLNPNQNEKKQYYLFRAHFGEIGNSIARYFVIAFVCIIRWLYITFFPLSDKKQVKKIAWEILQPVKILSFFKGPNLTILLVVCVIALYIQLQVYKKKFWDVFFIIYLVSVRLFCLFFREDLLVQDIWFSVEKIKFRFYLGVFFENDGDFII